MRALIRRALVALALRRPAPPAAPADYLRDLLRQRRAGATWGDLARQRAEDAAKAARKSCEV